MGDLKEWMMIMQAAVAAAWVIEQNHRQMMLAAAILLADSSDDEIDEDEDSDHHGVDEAEPKRKRQRTVSPRPDYSESEWGKLLKSDSLNDPISGDAKLFRKQFRVPYPFFLKLVKLVKEKEWFPRRSKDIAGQDCIPIELKVLAALMVLSSGPCFDEISHMSLMSEPRARDSFKTFCARCTSDLYEDWIRLPTGEDLEAARQYYDQRGMTGAMGNVEIAHVAWPCAPCTHVRSHTDEYYATLAYEVVMDHRGRIAGVTRGLPCAPFDETIARQDETVHRVRGEECYKSATYTVYGADGSQRTMEGLYLLCEGRFDEWKCMVGRIKTPRNMEEARFSRTVDGIRKESAARGLDALKGRFRALKLPVRYRKAETVDSIFFSCCILHNMLQAFDGVEILEGGINWAGADGDHDPAMRDPKVDFSRKPPSLYVSLRPEMEYEEGYAEQTNMLVEHLAYRTENKMVQRMMIG